MSLTFKNLKSPLLGWQSKIQVGKLRDCRVCDVAQDHYEYLIWAEKSGILKFTAETAQNIARIAGFVEQQQHYEQEVAPYLEDVPY